MPGNCADEGELTLSGSSCEAAFRRDEPVIRYLDMPGTHLPPDPGIAGSRVLRERDYHPGIIYGLLAGCGAGG